MKKQNVLSRSTDLKTWILMLLIAIVIISNVTIIAVAYFSDDSVGSSVVTMGTVSIDAKVDGEDKITLNNNNLIAGEVTTKTLTVDVTGTADCYVRVKSEFKIYVNGNFKTYDFVTFNITDSSENVGDNKNWVKHTDGYYYYKQVLNGTMKSPIGNITSEITYTVSEQFGNSNLDGSEVYNGQEYQITLYVETCQAEHGSDIGSGTSFNPTKWKTN